MEPLLIALSVICAGVGFSSPKPSWPLFGEENRRIKAWLWVRLVAFAGMVVCAAAVADLFVDEEASSWSMFWHIALAMWLPGWLLASYFQWRYTSDT